MRVASAFSGRTGLKFYVCEERRSALYGASRSFVLLFHLECWKIARAEIRAVERAQGTDERERTWAAISALAHSRLNANGFKLRISTHDVDGQKSRV